MAIPQPISSRPTRSERCPKEQPRAGEDKRKELGRHEVVEAQRAACNRTGHSGHHRRRNWKPHEHRASDGQNLGEEAGPFHDIISLRSPTFQKQKNVSIEFLGSFHVGQVRNASHFQLSCAGNVRRQKAGRRQSFRGVEISDDHQGWRVKLGQSTGGRRLKRLFVAQTIRCLKGDENSSHEPVHAPCDRPGPVCDAGRQPRSAPPAR